MVFCRRKLQQVLFIAIAVDVTIIFVILTGSLISLTSKETPSCTTSTCLQEGNRITHQIDTEINPCEDFYQFLCGRSQRNFDPIIIIKQQAKRQIISLYIEPSKPNEYPIVKTIKKLFQVCLKEKSPRISVSNIAQIKKELKSAGGWPLLEGSNWDENKFNLLDATYKFRELGYDHRGFLNLSVTEHPLNKTKFIFEVSLPKFGAFKQTFITEIAILFGGNETNLSAEVEEMYNSIVQLFYETKNFPWYDKTPKLYSVSTYQKKQGGAINWIEFINKIISPAASISENDLVIFPEPEKMTTWINLLSNIPKRIQANYIMWKAIEQIVVDIKYEDDFNFGKTNTDRCLEKIQKIFRIFPNPIDVLYIKEYLPKKKLKMVKDLVNNVRITFLKLLGNANWIDVNDKKNIINIMSDITKDVIIGAPEKYFQDNILDEMVVDLKETSKDDYLNILLQINKNSYSLLYKQIYSSVNDTLLLSWNLLKATEESLHYHKENVIALPATILQGSFFNEDRPNYLNYGSLGSFLAAEYGYHLIDVIISGKWSNKTLKGFLKVRRCFLQQVMDNLNINGVMSEWDFEMLFQALSTRISYSAYQNWEQSNGVELKLPSCIYTNYQLFWISAASFYCQDPFALPKTFGIHKQYSFYVSGIGLNNNNFANDFACPLESKMNPLEKCFVF